MANICVTVPKDNNRTSKIECEIRTKLDNVNFVVAKGHYRIDMLKKNKIYKIVVHKMRSRSNAEVTIRQTHTIQNSVCIPM